MLAVTIPLCCCHDPAVFGHAWECQLSMPVITAAKARARATHIRCPYLITGCRCQALANATMARIAEAIDGLSVIPYHRKG